MHEKTPTATTSPVGASQANRVESRNSALRVQLKRMPYAEGAQALSAGKTAAPVVQRDEGDSKPAEDSDGGPGSGAMTEDEAADFYLAQLSSVTHHKDVRELDLKKLHELRETHGSEPFYRKVAIGLNGSRAGQKAAFWLGRAARMGRYRPVLWTDVCDHLQGVGAEYYAKGLKGKGKPWSESARDEGESTADDAD